MIERVFARLQEEQILAIKIEAVGLDSTSVKVHPDGTGARKKAGRRPSAGRAEAVRPKCIWSPRLSGASSSGLSGQVNVATRHPGASFCVP